MSPRAAFRRKTYLIKKGLQFRYIGIVFALAFLASIVTGYTVFATGWTLLGEKLASVYPQGRLIEVLRAANMALIRNLLFVSPLIFLFPLFFSHRIAGPIYKIEKSIDEIARGNLALKIKLRKGDEFQDLADIMNVMTENVNATVASSKEAVLEIKQGLDELKKLASLESCDHTKIASLVDSLQAKVAGLNTSLNRWTTS